MRLIVSMLLIAVAFTVAGFINNVSASRFPRVDYNQTSWQQQWCDKEADMQAGRRRMGHIQKCPPGYKAGVGFSTRGPESAVRQCCYWYGTKRPRGVRNFGRYPVRWFSVRRAGNRWYAAALFRN